MARSRHERHDPALLCPRKPHPKHVALFEWLLEQAKKLGIHGGSAFRAIAGFGRHGVLHEEHFFELAADMTVEVEFVVTGEEAEKLLDVLRQERVSIFYARVPAE